MKYRWYLKWKLYLCFLKLLYNSNYSYHEVWILLPSMCKNLLEKGMIKPSHCQWFFVAKNESQMKKKGPFLTLVSLASKCLNSQMMGKWRIGELWRVKWKESVLEKKKGKRQCCYTKWRVMQTWNALGSHLQPQEKPALG